MKSPWRPLRIAQSFALLSLVLAACAPEVAMHTHDDPGEGVEARVDGNTVRSAFRAEDGWLVSPVLALDGIAERGGVLVITAEADAAPRIELGSEGSAWVPLEITSSEAGAHVGVAALETPASTLRLRVREEDAARIESLRWSASAADVERSETDSDLARSSEALSSDLADLVRPRSAWSARAGRGCSSDPATKYRFTIHHTEMAGGSDVRATLRSIQAFHMDSRGWCDVGYHFLIDQSGVIWEGRPLEILGAHAGDPARNRGNVGISFIGCFDDDECGGIGGPRRPSAASIEAAGRLVRRLSTRFGITVSTSTLKGHRDHISTTCPGDNLYSRLEEIRRLGRDEGTPPMPPPSLPAITVRWSRDASGGHRFVTEAPSSVARVELRVDDFVIGSAARGTAIDYRFSVERSERRLEARGLDAAGRQVALGVALLDVGSSTGVYIRQTGASQYEIGLERAPTDVRAIEVRTSGVTLTDADSGTRRSTRLAVRSAFTTLGSRTFEIDTYGADGARRGTLRRTLTLR